MDAHVEEAHKVVLPRGPFHGGGDSDLDKVTWEVLERRPVTEAITEYGEPNACEPGKEVDADGSSNVIPVTVVRDTDLISGRGRRTRMKDGNCSGGRGRP